MILSAFLYRNAYRVNNTLGYRFKRWDIVIMITFALVFGMRYNLGIDYPHYLNHYIFKDFERFEFVFKNISLFLANNGFHVVVFFSLWCFLQIYFLMKSFEKEKFIYPALIFTLFTGQYFLLWMNVIRQDIAACIFIFSIYYIADKNLFKYLLCILLAIGFHNSAILLLAVYPLFSFKKEYFRNIKLQILFFFCSIGLMLSIDSTIQYLDIYIDKILDYSSFADTYGNVNLDNYTAGTIIGGTFVINILIDTIIILNSKKMKEYYNNDRFSIFYDLYFGGMLINNVFASSFLLARPFRYFRYFRMIITAYLIYYLFRNSKKKLNLFYLVLILLLSIFSYISLFRYGGGDYYQYLFFPFD